MEERVQLTMEGKDFSCSCHHANLCEFSLHDTRLPKSHISGLFKRRYWLDCLQRKQTLLNLWRKIWTQWIIFKVTYILTWLYPNIWLWITWSSILTGNLTSCGLFSEMLKKCLKWIPLESLIHNTSPCRVPRKYKNQKYIIVNISELCSENWLTWSYFIKPFTHFFIFYISWLSSERGTDLKENYKCWEIHSWTEITIIWEKLSFLLGAVLLKTRVGTMSLALKM